MGPCRSSVRRIGLGNAGAQRVGVHLCLNRVRRGWKGRTCCLPRSPGTFQKQAPLRSARSLKHGTGATKANSCQSSWIFYLHIPAEDGWFARVGRRLVHRDCPGQGGCPKERSCWIWPWNGRIHWPITNRQGRFCKAGMAVSRHSSTVRVMRTASGIVRSTATHRPMSPGSRCKHSENPWAFR